MSSDNIKKLTKRELQQRVEKLETELEEKLNQIKYLQADFDNYRKNFEKEKEKIIELANENLIKDFLEIIDGFEKALSALESNKDKEGLMMLYKNFFRILEKHGLKRIEALNKKFDPYYHEALLREKSDKEDGIILEEIQPGYILKSKVIRHSKVKVADNKNEGDKNKGK